MIENVVFDLGGVLMHFDPIGFSRLFTDTEEDAELICQALALGLHHSGQFRFCHDHGLLPQIFYQKLAFDGIGKERTT